MTLKACDFPHEDYKLLVSWLRNPLVLPADPLATLQAGLSVAQFLLFEASNADPDCHPTMAAAAVASHEKLADSLDEIAECFGPKPKRKMKAEKIDWSGLFKTLMTLLLTFLNAPPATK